MITLLDPHVVDAQSSSDPTVSYLRSQMNLFACSFIIWLHNLAIKREFTNQDMSSSRFHVFCMEHQPRLRPVTPSHFSDHTAVDRMRIDSCWWAPRWSRRSPRWSACSGWSRRETVDFGGEGCLPENMLIGVIVNIRRWLIFINVRVLLCACSCVLFCL